MIEPTAARKVEWSTFDEETGYTTVQSQRAYIETDPVTYYAGPNFERYTTPLFLDISTGLVVFDVQTYEQGLEPTGAGPEVVDES